MSNDNGEVRDSPSRASDPDANGAEDSATTGIVIASGEIGGTMQDDSTKGTEQLPSPNLDLKATSVECHSEDVDEPKNIDESKAVDVIEAALDTTVDTATSVDANEEVVGGPLSLDDDPNWDPFGLLSADDVEVVGKNIRILRRQCLTMIVCILLFAIVGTLASLSNENRRNNGIDQTSAPTAPSKASRHQTQPTASPSSSSRPTPDLGAQYRAPTSTYLPTTAPTDTMLFKKHDTSEPTYTPSIISNEPSDGPSGSPTRPTTAEPTNEPSNRPTNDLPQYDTFSFYVLGDAPYTEAEEFLLRQQLSDISNSVTDEDMFLLHVGDLMRARTTHCARRNYQFIEDVFTQELPNLPVFLIPGDNDWNDCPDPDLAWQYWEDHFMAFERNYMGVRPYLPFVERQPERQENFGFVLNGVLIIGLNQVAGIDDIGYEERLDHNIMWIDEQVNKYQDEMASGTRIRLCIIFAHSSKGARVFRHAQRMLSGYSVPTLVLKGDGHTFDVSNNLRDVGQNFGWDLFKVVQVARGGMAPPMRITIQGTSAEALKAPIEVGESNNELVFWDGLVFLDRRGGIYSTFVEAEDVDDE